ncbi:hypothetical protein WOLCODRAFT_164504 [Wolfiporia cocos MD-104 SS10]|uniref:F-box domain-containing protein n=1 Tax=Wolfiporia cocos (strain MD-104) TaxID=742152 RepID=A0A2H3JPU5_WOLCO|nr:hypothetical protein WOLCODRAFT_164504 [Wolfiporia cocos MD-104 SS10]
MHRALEDYDILAHVFGQFEPTTSRNDRVALVQLARVSRAFSHHALNFLWRRLTDLVPALSIISSFEAVTPAFDPDPDDENAYIDDEIEGDAYYLTDVISPNDLERFQQYASRVRILSFSSGKSWASRASVLSCVTTFSRGPLFPALQELDWSQSSPSDITILSLLTPTLTRLSLDHVSGTLRGNVWSTEHRGFTTILHAISTNIPCIQELNIQTKCSPSVLLRLVRPGHLRKVNLYPSEMDRKLYQSLSASKTLVEMDIRLFVNENVTFMHGFSVLRKLDIAGRLPDITRFVAAITSPTFHSITVWDYQSNSDIRDLHLFFALLRHKFKTSLRHVTCGTKVIGAQALPLLDLMRPLMDLFALEGVTLNSLTPFRASSSDFVQLATAWPSIRTLQICYDSAEADAAPHVSVLQVVARLCPSLLVLTLPSLDFAPPYHRTLGLAGRNDDGVMPIQPHGLRELNVGFYPRRPVEDPGGVARFIVTLFPDLARAFLSARAPQGTEPDRHAWGKLIESLRALQTERRLQQVTLQ